MATTINGAVVAQAAKMTRQPNKTQAESAKMAAAEVAKTAKPTNTPEAKKVTMPSPMKPALPSWPEGVEVVGDASLLRNPKLVMAARVAKIGKEVLGAECKSIRAYVSMSPTVSICHIRLIPVATIVVLTDGSIVIGAMTHNMTENKLEPGHEDRARDIFITQLALHKSSVEAHEREMSAIAAKEMAVRLSEVGAEVQNLINTKAKEANMSDALMQLDAGYGDIFQVRDNTKDEVYECWKAETKEIGEDQYEIKRWSKLPVKGVGLLSDALRLLANEMDRLDAEAKAARLAREAEEAKATTRKAPQSAPARKGASPPAKGGGGTQGLPAAKGKGAPEPRMVTKAKGGAVVPVAKAQPSNKAQAAKSSAITRKVQQAAKSPAMGEVLKDQAAKAGAKPVTRKVAPRK